MKEKIREKLHEIATDLSLLSDHGELQVVENCGHLIHVDRPKVVIETIQKLLYKAVRTHDDEKSLE